MTLGNEAEVRAGAEVEELSERAAMAARLAGIDASLVVRTARKVWRCTCAEGRNYLPSCTGAAIRSGEVHVEYLGDAAPYESGNRYHAACAIEAWTRPPPSGPSVVDLDGLPGSGGGR